MKKEFKYVLHYKLEKTGDHAYITLIEQSDSLVNTSQDTSIELGTISHNDTTFRIASVGCFDLDGPVYRQRAVNLYLHGRASDMSKIRTPIRDSAPCDGESSFNSMVEAFEKIMLAAGYTRVIFNKMEEGEYRFVKD